MPYRNVVSIKQRLNAQGLLESSLKISGWERFKQMAPNGKCMAGLGIGVFLVLLFSQLRQYFPKWPFHPIIFLVWSTMPNGIYADSFLIGWLMKTSVLKFGGFKIYEKLKPFAVGLIAGELLTVIITIIFGTIFYFITGHSPVPYRL